MLVTAEACENVTFSIPSYVHLSIGVVEIIACNQILLNFASPVQTVQIDKTTGCLSLSFFPALRTPRFISLLRLQMSVCAHVKLISIPFSCSVLYFLSTTDLAVIKACFSPYTKNVLYVMSIETSRK
jgi:hypothetical protein